MCWAIGGLGWGGLEKNYVKLVMWKTRDKTEPPQCAEHRGGKVALCCGDEKGSADNDGWEVQEGEVRRIQQGGIGVQQENIGGKPVEGNAGIGADLENTDVVEFGNAHDGKGRDVECIKAILEIGDRVAARAEFKDEDI